MAEADEEEDAAEQQCVLLRTEQIAGEKKKQAAKTVGVWRDGNGRRGEEEKKQESVG